jgi:hypothetical protein
MNAEPAPTDRPIVHALLVCRGVEADERGEVTIQNVLEVLPVEEVPTEVGPLTFLALVRNLPQGAGSGAFLLRPQGAETAPARLPIEVEVPAGYAGRQIALQVRVPTLPIGTGGWFEVEFEWAGEVLATNRFAVGVKG